MTKKPNACGFGSIFEGVINFEIKGDFCHIKVMLNVKKPLRRGIFIGTREDEQKWLPFKYENLPAFVLDVEN